MISKIKTFIKALYGLSKIACINPNNIPILKNKESNPQIIVSLTSYGRRIEKTVFYTIVSILKQTIQPDRIILWLDNSWNLTHIPERLKKLMRSGVEICFCPDFKSYKKLLPTLEKYPNAIIITVDDDVFYSPHLIETLLDGYYQNGNIQCTEARIPKTIKSKFIPYKDWKPVLDPNCINILPIGVGGVLYPPGSLSSEVMNPDFIKLAPNADDLWFWIMAKRNNSKHSYNALKFNYLPFDAIYQFFHKGSALTHNNKKENQNDIQLKQIVSIYNLPDDIFSKMETQY